MAAPLKVRLIANPVAGRRAPEQIARARETLTRLGAEVDLFLTTARGDARRAAAEARNGGFDRVIAAGGDGTLNEVVNGLAPSAIPLAFIPLGTTNVFALEVGIPFDVEAACRIALSGRTQPVSLGLAGGTRFLLMAGIGFDAEVVYGVSSRLKRLTGKAAYVASGLSTLFLRPPRPLEVRLPGGETRRAYAVILGNGRLYGGRFSITPQAALTREGLEAFLLLRPGRLALLRFALRVALGRPLPPEEALTLTVRELRIDGDPAPVQIDGDYLGRTPMEFRALSGEITLVFP